MVIVTIWGLRLSGYVLWRNAGKPEDFRYAKWRSEAPGNWWIKSYLQVFILQGFLMWLIGAPLLAAQYFTSPLGWLDIAACVVWLVGFFFEAAGDWQLSRFKSNPENKGKVLDKGVWRYTRHPNYFGDSTQWWGYYLIAASAGGWWTIFSPIIMTFFLLNVSGVAMLERTLRETKPQYRDYIERTSSFIPWVPKKTSTKE
jgi:steroid 5-alpha reductase family enzyme